MQCKDVYRGWYIDSLIIESLGRDLHTDSKWIGLIACLGMGKIDELEIRRGGNRSSGEARMDIPPL